MGCGPDFMGGMGMLLLPRRRGGMSQGLEVDLTEARAGAWDGYALGGQETNIHSIYSSHIV
ncbi:unnamed protein product [Prunus armeniaca]|uniref:Uncharacterized protein n=1 Tax=Prunus armeniaca TaxID=36596 RepID=A0A6J5W730_PRUAR|nr:unnamed protein product [Prunus armeniaca]